MKKIRIICFDIDNVICMTDRKKNYRLSKPIKKNVKVINCLYNKGFQIKLFTARYMSRCNENSFLARKKAEKLTIDQLKKWGVKYHNIIFGKPSYDLFIDDKALFYKKNWSKFLLKKFI